MKTLNKMFNKVYYNYGTKGGYDKGLFGQDVIKNTEDGYYNIITIWEGGIAGFKVQEIKTGSHATTITILYNEENNQFEKVDTFVKYMDNSKTTEIEKMVDLYIKDFLNNEELPYDIKKVETAHREVYERK